MEFYCSKCKRPFFVSDGPFVKAVKPSCPTCTNNKYVTRRTRVDDGKKLERTRITRHKDTQFAKS